MEKSLFEQARDMINNVTNNQNMQSQEDQEAVRNAIQAAYREATPEEQNQLRQLEQQLNENMNLH